MLKLEDERIEVATRKPERRPRPSQIVMSYELMAVSRGAEFMAELPHGERVKLTVRADHRMRGEECLLFIRGECIGRFQARDFIEVRGPR